VYRKIDCRVWSDENFLELSGPQRLMWFALLTHPSMTPMGAGVFTTGMLQDAIASKDDVEEILAELERRGMILRSGHLIVVRRFLVYNCPTSVNVLAGWIGMCAALPKSDVFRALADQLMTVEPALPGWLFTCLLEPLAEGKQWTLQANTRELTDLFWTRSGVRKPSPPRNVPANHPGSPGEPSPEPSGIPSTIPSPISGAVAVAVTATKNQVGDAGTAEPSPASTSLPLIEDDPAAKQQKPKGSDLKAEAKAWIAMLNEESGRQFRGLDADVGKATARIREGFTLADARLVVQTKVKEWLGDPKMAEYLRPETLFGTKFQSYLAAAKAKQSHPPPVLQVVQPAHVGIRVVKCYRCKSPVNANVTDQPCPRCGAPYDEEKYA
jgi:uncharacterized phage protein (TIGR02220 family)